MCNQSEEKKKIKVVLFGDSIRMRGSQKVIEGLGDDYVVFQPDENCRFAQYVLRLVFEHRQELENADIVQFNSGLWDVCNILGDGPFTPLDDYIKLTLRIVRMLKKYTDKIIFVTTTPVSLTNDYNNNTTIKEYNDAITPLLLKEGVIVNDLFTPIYEDLDKYINVDTIHLSDEGVDLYAKQVVKVIREVAKTL